VIAAVGGPGRPPSASERVPMLDGRKFAKWFFDMGTSIISLYKTHHRYVYIDA
jgi:hypothetical protein